MFVKSDFAFVAPASQERQSRVKATITSVHEGDRGIYGGNLPKLCADFAPKQLIERCTVLQLSFVQVP